MLNLKSSLSEKILSMLSKPQIKIIYVLGGTDVGKTAFISSLLGILVKNYSIGVVDCDLGQSHIGPPTTIGWARVLREFNSWEALKLEDFYFVGGFSPSGNIQRTLEGVKFIYSKAKEKTDKIIFDTTGYISGLEAIDFKRKKIELIQPDLIVALERENELEEILDYFKEYPVLRILVSEKIRLKSQEMRVLYRDKCFRRYFSFIKEFLFLGNKFERLDKKDLKFIDKIVSLRNVNGEDLALGLIKDKKDSEILILTPFEKFQEVDSIVIGLCKWQKNILDDR